MNKRRVFNFGVRGRLSYSMPLSRPAGQNNGSNLLILRVSASAMASIKKLGFRKKDICYLTIHERSYTPSLNDAPPAFISTDTDEISDLRPHLTEVAATYYCA